MSGLPDTIPGWLMNDWSQYLREQLVDQVVSDEALQALFQATLARWRSRPNHLKERTIVKYLGFTRTWISQLSLTELTRVLNPETKQYEHRALRHFLLPTEKYAELNDQSRAKVDWRNEHQLLLPDPLAIINRLIELLDHADWAPLAVALAGLTGRRVGEVLLSGTVNWKSAYSVDFSGRLKRQGAPEKIFEIPTACEAQRVVDGWERLRSHPDLHATYPQFFEEIPPEKVNQVLRQLNRDLSPIVRKAADYYFQALIPTLEEDQSDKEVQRWGVYTHLFRSVYSTIATWFYCPVPVHPDAFAAAVLGHTYYAKTDEGEERLNYSSGQHYHRYGISDGKGNHDGRRGIRLGDPNYPGVKVIEQFEKEYAMQQQVLQEGSSQKRKKREKKPSKTGYSSIRPRSETRDWFDQVAEENELTWKPTDATLKLLLETYEAHKRCQQAGVAVPTQTQITPTLLGLDAELAAQIEAGMQATGQESFVAYLKQALVRESKTQIGLAKSRKDREGEDVSKQPWASIKGLRRPDASFERIRRAIANLIDHNRACTDPDEFWFINVNLLRDYIGASPDFITPVLKANQELVERHHAHFKITRSHNGRPFPKKDKLSLEILPIPENPAEIKSLGEIVLPGQEEEASESEQVAEETVQQAE